MPENLSPENTAPEAGERLAKRLAHQLACSRREAELYIENGAVLVDGQVVEALGTRVQPQQQVSVAPGARALPVPPATLLLHKPAGFTVGEGQPSAWSLLTPERWQQGPMPAPIKVLKKHFQHQTPLLALPIPASGLTVFSQDERILRKLTQDALFVEQECIAQVRGKIAPGGLERLCDGTAIAGKRLPRIKVSWQNEQHLRFALQGIFPHEIEAMCAGVGLQLVGLKRLRVGRIALAGLAEGHWRYLQPWERF